ncbi:MAG TPA: DUF2271 domain-containing protein [Humisphaera sp.]|jgi:thiamine biosynthesis lipoprotein ApbE|nr:DUF2271 domain-containing protein [Humisphaera sp.]
MKRRSMRKNDRDRFARRLLAGAAAVGLAGISVAPVASYAAVPHPVLVADQVAGQYSFGFEGVLGTSMDLVVDAASDRQAIECRRAVLGEIDRLAAIFSTYDPTSEISRLMSGALHFPSSGTPRECRGGGFLSGATLQKAPTLTLPRSTGGGNRTGTFSGSKDLCDLFDRHAFWKDRTDGALDLNVAGVKELWRIAALQNRLPNESDLHAAYARPRAWNVDALGKALIIDRAVAVARNIIPSGLLNIGGDIRAWGQRDWPIGVVDPSRPAENATPIAIFNLRDAAVATSGSYARFFTINGKRYSHLLDPRTLSPIDDPSRSATVVANDCVTANAISTASCVLGREAAADLANDFASGHLFIDDSGASTTGTLRAPPAQVVCSPAATEDAAASKWPTGFQVNIGVSLKTISGGRGGAKRPYVAIWIEDENDKLVRNLTIWGDRDKYIPELSAWWKANNGSERRIRSLTSATRPPGKYNVVWNGRDDEGRPVPQGEYHVYVEINREHGRHVREWASIVCQDGPQSATIAVTAESDESKIEYGPGKK